MDRFPGVFVIDESALAVDADDTRGFDVVSDGDVPLEHILQITANGSFPPADRRENLPDGARRQLRDAMIFEAHIRAGEHLFVSDDERAFTRHGKRSLLEVLGRTRILTLPELVELAEGEGLSGLLPPP